MDRTGQRYAPNPLGMQQEIPSLLWVALAYPAPMDANLEQELQRLEEVWDADLAYAYRWLRKSGLETGLYEELAVQAPRVTLALSTSLGMFEYFEEYLEARQVKGRLSRAKQLAAIEKEPNATWQKTRPQVYTADVPLLESWIDRCANAERRVYGEQPTSDVGKRASHPKFGPGTITALAEETATIRFDDGSEKKIRMDFLEVDRSAPS